MFNYYLIATKLYHIYESSATILRQLKEVIQTPSSETLPHQVLYHEFVLTSKNFIRTVTQACPTLLVTTLQGQGRCGMELFKVMLVEVHLKFSFANISICQYCAAHAS